MMLVGCDFSSDDSPNTDSPEIGIRLAVSYIQLAGQSETWRRWLDFLPYLNLGDVLQIWEFGRLYWKLNWVSFFDILPDTWYGAMEGVLVNLYLGFGRLIKSRIDHLND